MIPASVFHGIFVASHSCTFCSLGIKLHTSLRRLPQQASLRKLRYAMLEPPLASALVFFSAFVYVMPPGHLLQSAAVRSVNSTAPCSFSRSPSRQSSSFSNCHSRQYLPGRSAPLCGYTCVRTTTAGPKLHCLLTWPALLSILCGVATSLFSCQRRSSLLSKSGKKVFGLSRQAS